MSGADHNLGGEVALTKHKKHGHRSMTDGAPKKHKHHHKQKEEEEDSDFTESSSDSDASDESEYESEEEAEPVVTVVDAVLSLIPFTKQYKAAEDAISHLNDIKGMQAEVTVTTPTAAAADAATDAAVPRLRPRPSSRSHPRHHYQNRRCCPHLVPSGQTL